MKLCACLGHHAVVALMAGEGGGLFRQELGLTVDPAAVQLEQPDGEPQPVRGLIGFVG